MINTKQNEKTVPIFFSCDDNYIPYLAVSLESLEKNADLNRNYHIKVLHSNSINLDNQAKIKNKYQNDIFDVEFVDITPYVEKLASKLFTRDYYSKATYYRLFIPNLYPQYDKALYLDSDIVVLKDISKLYDTQLGSNYVGAIPDESVQLIKEFQDYVENRIHVDHYSKYFNAGILLMNLDELRKDNFEDMFIDMLTNVKFTVAQDQDYLNSICAGKVTFVPAVWDKMPFPSDIKENDLCLIHYNLDMKPWQKDGVLYENYFWDYAKNTDYYNVILETKKNYPKELIEKKAEETAKLIQQTKREAEEYEENKRILDVIKRVCKNRRWE